METILQNSVRRNVKSGPLYRCDPRKAIKNGLMLPGCAAACHLRGGPCYSTINVSHALLDEYGRPIPSDDYMELLCSSVYNKQKFNREDIVMDSNEEEQ